MLTNQRREQLKRKIPKIIIIATVIAVCLYILLEIADVIEGGTILSLTQNITATIQSWGYAGIFGLMLLEASSLPIPSEVVLPFAGFLVFKEYIDFWLTVIVATAAGVAGSLIDYYIGLKGVRILTERKILGTIFSMDQIENATKWFNKYGSFMVFIGRLVPVLRTLISFPAGAVRMPIAKFLTYTAAGCIIWNILLVYLGYFLGANWNEVAGVSHYIIVAGVAATVAALVIYYAYKRRTRK